MTIHVLPPDVAAKIAAGEVVERPANVAKELLENSLDAGATEIRVEMREGGARLLRVADDGHGIPPNEAELAFRRHATSKLETADDLAAIGTFGFRGEALYSIAAVSHVTLATRTTDEPAGIQLRVAGGTPEKSQKTGTPPGTIVTVEHLFYNVPARKKFLRKAAAEAGQIANIVQRYALAHPQRRFTLINDGRTVLQTTGSGDLFDVLVQLYGLENAKQMVPVGSQPRAGKAQSTQPELDAEVDFMAWTGPDAGRTTQGAGAVAGVDLRIAGYTSLPTWSRANRNAIDLFVNGRYIKDQNLTYAVTRAYHTLLPEKRFPIAVIMMAVDPAQVDVNVHPQKTQVRFLDERRMGDAVQRAVHQALLQHSPAPGMHLPSHGTTVEPKRWSGLDAWSQRREEAENHAPGTTLFDNYEAETRDSRTDIGTGVASAGAVTADWHGDWDEASFAAAAEQTEPDTVDTVEKDADAPVQAEAARSKQGAITGSEEDVPESDVPASDVQASKAAGKDISKDIEVRASALPPLRVVGQVGTTYIVAEGPEGMYLIDQHAAHERILYEQFMARRFGTVDGGIAAQHLLEPLTLHLGHELTGLIADHLEELQAVGYAVEPFGGDAYLVRAVPNVLSDQDPLQALSDIVHALGDRRNRVGETFEERLVKMVCKRAAIKAGQLLSPIEMRELVRQLEECRAPRTCPHGRPTMIQLSAGELEKAFGRI